MAENFRSVTGVLAHTVQQEGGSISGAQSAEVLDAEIIATKNIDRIGFGAQAGIFKFLSDVLGLEGLKESLIDTSGIREIADAPNAALRAIHGNSKLEEMFHGVPGVKVTKDKQGNHSLDIDGDVYIEE